MERRISKIEIYDKNFWNNLEKLRQILVIFSRKDRAETNSCSTTLITVNKEEVIPVNSDPLAGSKDTEKYSKVYLLGKIKKIFKEFVSSQDGRKTLAVPDRKTWKNTNFEKDCGIQLIKNPVLKTVGKCGPASTKRLIMLQHLLTKIYKLIETDSYKTKRELYYEDVNLFKSQSIVDNLLDDIACLLNVSKTHLHVLTTSKGCIAGTLRFKDAEGNYLDCSETARGMLISNNVQDITNIQSEARFILVIEKSAVFEMVIDNDILSFFHPCILITGKGFPDINTRELLRKLFDSLQIPILGLFDADPYGIEIFGTYKYGSKAMAFDVENLAVPEMRWLGLLPTDIQRLNLPAESTMPLSENDKRKANQLLNLPYIQHHQLWLNEVQVMLKMEKKAEIEGLSKINPVFLPSIYLPNKIKYGGWI